ncbi:Ataxin 3/Josephin [Phaffia rhodozyma]|uniref:ubiquitinyl hydrolase 1 n=1 Tax=Phaffia rhodozyma TaxID=264483 RepID=A0A0F7SKU5_PHARH|nr:Ataxin 3/Josephin [Phaffia rhodozyma]
MDLVSRIFHETQEPGSNMCGQHALNNLLQSHYFEPTDLASIALQLDSDENERLSQARSESVNMDDTGFFSVQVLDRGLEVWELSLDRWRSEELRPHWDRPEDQQAFILNLDSHWFTLRRFGGRKDRWYNLNSFFSQPAWVSPTYLTMVLNQAESEGYSVFVVRPRSSASSSSSSSIQSEFLESSAADRFAVSLPIATSATSGSDRSTHSRISKTSVGGEVDWGAYGNFDDEASELEAALAASLANVEPENTTPSAPGPIVRPPIVGSELVDPADPVQISLERARATMAAFERDQAAAFQDTHIPSSSFPPSSFSFIPPNTTNHVSEMLNITTPIAPRRGSREIESETEGTSRGNRRRRQADPSSLETPFGRALSSTSPLPNLVGVNMNINDDDDDDDEIREIGSSTFRRSSGSGSGSGRTSAKTRNRPRHDEDEEMMRLAIEVSIREQEERDRSAARANRGARNAMDVEDDDDDADENEVGLVGNEDEDEEIEEDDHADIFSDPPTTFSTSTFTSTPSPFGGPTNDQRDRDYDDEDEQLQAALKASMEGGGGTKQPSPEPELTPAQLRALRLARFGG